MKKLWIFTLYNRMGASSNYRIYIYEDILKEHFDTVIYPFWTSRYVQKCMGQERKHPFMWLIDWTVGAVRRYIQIGKAARCADAVLFQKDAIPLISKCGLKRLQKNGIKIIFDNDDATYLSRVDTSDNVAGGADLVICGNEYLKAHYDGLGLNTRVVPTTDITDSYVPYHKDTFDNHTIGWVGGRSSAGSIGLIKKPLKAFLLEHPESRFVMVGSEPLEYFLDLPNYEFVKWSPDTVLDVMSRFTIGIMPLEDNEFTRGKCGFKLVQYLAMGKPVIGSDVGVNKSIIGRCGIAVGPDETDWSNAISSLIYDRSTYEGCRRYISEDFEPVYSYGAVANSLLAAIDEVMS